ncbi:hypothetical protein SOPP22_07195 [Shewanella sp. OPT22]|nr:hypothetical protein SOPP22_07195 [Shewanella sp. OPT22]
MFPQSSPISIPNSNPCSSVDPSNPSGTTRPPNSPNCAAATEQLNENLTRLQTTMNSLSSEMSAFHFQEKTFSVSPPNTERSPAHSTVAENGSPLISSSSATDFWLQNRHSDWVTDESMNTSSTNEFTAEGTTQSGRKRSRSCMEPNTEIQTQAVKAFGEANEGYVYKRMCSEEDTGGLFRFHSRPIRSWSDPQTGFNLQAEHKMDLS